MDYKRFRTFFQKDAATTYWLIVLVVSLIWLTTLLDQLFRLGWKTDWRGIWIAPLILLSATAIKFFHSAVDKLVDHFSGQG
jgi:hypothetical protein